MQVQGKNQILFGFWYAICVLTFMEEPYNKITIERRP